MGQNMKLKILFVCVAAILLPACQTTGMQFQQNETKKLSYDEKSKHAVEIRRTAAETFLYAQMANNAYLRSAEKTYNLPDYVKQVDFEFGTVDNTGNNETGMAFSVFEIARENKPELVIAYRGSEPNFLDWMLGNVLGKQAPQSIDLFDALKRENPNHDISVVGDSLGGSLATQVSLCREVKLAVSVDTSPRFSSKHCYDGLKDNKRHSITERGEFLKFFRLGGREATQLYTSVNCVPGWGPFQQHSAFDLTKCLTEMASVDVGNNANLSISLNPHIFIELNEN